MAAVLGEMEVGLGGDALVGGDVARSPRQRSGAFSAARTETAWPRALRQAGSAKASSACRRRLSRGTIQQMRSTTPASMSRAAAITGSSDLAAARGDGGQDIGEVGLSQDAIAATMPATSCWCERRGRCIRLAASRGRGREGQHPAEGRGPA